MTVGSARIAWFDTFGALVERDRPAPDVGLPPPDRVTAKAGRGQVTVDWSPVDGAAGYLVHRAPAADGPWTAIDHQGGDVLAVPHGPYVDTRSEAGAPTFYAVATLSSIDAPVGALSAPVEARTLGGPGGAASIRIEVDTRDVRGPVERPWQPIIGSEHLALLLRGEGPGGHHVGDELAEAFRIVHDELGVRSVRAHGILHDSLGVYREHDGRPRLDFERLDAAVARLLDTGLTPVVELSFMPHDLAADPSQTVFDYRGIISPPRDLHLWGWLVAELATHLGARFGADAVARWPFEVWNEPNLKVFWAGTQADYFALYDASARAIKAVDERILVGGPSTSAVGWVDDLLAHAADAGVPVDFLTTHTYGLPPLDLRPIAARYGGADLPLYWTEWGISPTHGAPVNDSAWGAPLVCRGMRSAAGRLDALAYWVASDHFVELGEPDRLLHGGFGLLTLGNLRKPRFWALRVLESLGSDELACSLSGDGAGSLVEAWATRDEDGRVAVAIWNGTLDQTKQDGDPALDRDVTLAITALRPGRYRLRHRRVDLEHSNVSAAAAELGVDVWPDERQWAELRRRDVLEDLEPERELTISADGRGGLAFRLPMPGVSLVELTPA